MSLNKSNILNSEIPVNFLHSPFTNVTDYILSRIIENGQNSGNDFCAITNARNNETYNFQDIPELVCGVAQSFQERGLKKGDTVLYSSHDGAKLHIFLLGVWKAGGIARASYPEDNGDELLERIVESEVKWILCADENAADNIKIASKAPWPVEIIVSGKAPLHTINVDEFVHVPRKDVPIIEHESKLEDIALILQTSGTTGKSKGAVYTHERLLNNIKILEKVPFTKNVNEKFLLTSKLTHFTGTVFPLAFFSSCKGILIDPKPSLESIVHTISVYKVDGLLAFPKYLMCLANEKLLHEPYLNSLKYAITAGQVVGPSFISAVKSIPSIESLLLIYGMTEVGILSVTAAWQQDLKSEPMNEIPPFSCGTLAPGNKLFVKDLKTEENLSVDEAGEFYFSSPYASNGYYKRVEDTRKTFGNGWIQTGDVGYFDSKGFLFLKDRVKDVFKYFNNHICPSEIENILLRHHAIWQACVIGVPDPEGGDTIPRAFVVLRNEFVRDKGNIVYDIQKFVNENVASYKQIRGGIFILNELPIGKTGKVMRNLLQTHKLHSESG